MNYTQKPTGDYKAISNENHQGVKKKQNTSLLDKDHYSLLMTASHSVLLLSFFFVFVFFLPLGVFMPELE